jgi:hypothetical protein
MVHVPPVVLAERLFVEIAEQVEGLDRNISAIDAPLQVRPVVLKSVRVNLATHVLDRMVNTFDI